MTSSRAHILPYRLSFIIPEPTTPVMTIMAMMTMAMMIIMVMRTMILMVFMGTVAMKWFHLFMHAVTLSVFSFLSGLHPAGSNKTNVG